MGKRALLLAAVALAALGGVAAPAGAGSYEVTLCGKNPSNAFSAFTGRHVLGMTLQRSCSMAGRGDGGLVTKSGRRGTRARAEGYIALNAPAGARFSRYVWWGEHKRNRCEYTVTSYATRPGLRLRMGGPEKPHLPAFRRCGVGLPTRADARQSGYRNRSEHNLDRLPGGATRIVHGLACGSKRGCRPGTNFVRVQSSTVTVTDFTAPSVAITGGELVGERWVSGEKVVEYTASDNVGVKAGRAVVGGRALSVDPRPCSTAQLVRCANGPASIRVNTRDLNEGTQPLELEAIDSADNAARSAARQVGIDNTPPARVGVAVDGGEGWRRTPDFTLRWANPDEGDRAPIAAARYRLCAKGARQCPDARVAGDRISELRLTAPAPGEHTATLWREDQAGNHAPDNDSVPVTLRYDPEPPRPAFDAQSGSDPTRVTVSVVDRVSGLASGGIEIGRAGSGSWQALQTGIEGDKLVARIDDSRYPPGQYALRARAADHAGNEASTTTRADGSPMLVTLPLRVATTMHAGLVRKRTVRRRARGKRRRVTVLRPSGRARFGRVVPLGGRLRNGQGDAIAGARVLVYSRTPTEAERLAGTTTTDRAGRYRFRARASSSRTFRFVYEGTRLILPAQDEVRLLVRAASSIRVSRRRVRNGRAVAFSGRLWAPMERKLVELQVLLSGRFQTFKTALTDGRGRWLVRYRFRRSCGLIRYRFRLRIPPDASYPFETGTSRSVGVRVRGPRCP